MDISHLYSSNLPKMDCSLTTDPSAQKQIPMQDIASALLNGALQAMRRAVGDRLVYDPSRIAKENIASESPSARIPVRPAGYGGDLNRMVYKIPYEDHVTPRSCR